MSFLNRFFIYNLFSLARFSHAKKYLLKRARGLIDPYNTFVLAKDRQRSLCIWAIQQMKHRGAHVCEDLYLWKLGKRQWLANIEQVHGLYEYLNGSFDQFYRCPCKGKRVLDIGGYIGDSARYFLEHGAKKVIIYEPVSKNITTIRHNLDGEAIELHEKAVAERDGAITISSNYPAGHIGFGNRAGNYTIDVEAESFSTILSKTQADVAKVDCEGNEKYLLDVPAKELQRIPYWMIEIHDSHLIDTICDKFRTCGFERIPVEVPPHHLGVYHFQLRRPVAP